MRPLERTISLFAPHICLGCGVEEDNLLCEACVQQLPLVPSRCYRCKAVTDDYAVCAACAPRTPLRRVAVYTHHKDLAKELIHHMKYERAQSGVREAAQLLAGHSMYFEADCVLVAVPTATSRVRARGYDHASLLTHSLSELTNIPNRTLLARVGQAHQVGARRSERMRQLQGAFRPLHESDIRNRHIILVDDVLTTGATLESAAKVLKKAGAKQVDALVFAQA